MEKENLIKKIFYAVTTALLIAIVVLLSMNLYFTLSKDQTEIIPSLTKQQLSAMIMPSVAETSSSGLTASGVLISSDNGKNYLITNKHAIVGDSVSVRFYGESDFYKGSLVKFSDYHDIAVIYCERIPLKAKPAIINLDTAITGDEILVVGNAIGAGVSVFEGIISKNDRFLNIKNINNEGNKVVPVYQISAPVNAGASGGGLFNASGELVGINTYQSISAEENSEARPVDGISYSVPAAIAMAVYNAEKNEDNSVKLIEVRCGLFGKNHEIQFNSLGIYIKPYNGTIEVTKGDKLPEMSGEIKTGDKIIKFGAVNVTDKTVHADLFKEIYKYKKGNGEPYFTVVIERNEKTEEIIYTSTGLV